MALIVIIAPGSLAISSNFQRSKPCTVPTVPDSLAKYGSDNSMFGSYIGILTSSTYLPPFRAVTCDSGASSCSYNVSFVGPAFHCIDVSNQTNFTDLFHPQNVDPEVLGLGPSAPFLIWDATSFEGDDPSDFPVGISVLTQDLVKGVAQANNCTAYNATYEVGVSLEGESTSLQVWDVTLHTVLKIDETENPLSFYTRDAVILLSTTIYAGTHGYVTSGGDEVQSAAFFVTTPTGNHTWSGNITDVLTSYMQNVSLSFLSDDVTTGFSNATATKPFYVNSTCVSTFTVYAYDPIRLLSSYGIALAVAFLTLVHGCGLILRNGAEEKLVLSHIFRFALNEKLVSISGEVQGKTRVRLERGDPGKLLPKSANPSVIDVSYAAEKPGESTEQMNGCIVF